MLPVRSALCKHPGGYTSRERSAVLLLLQWGQVGIVSVQLSRRGLHPSWIKEASMLDLEESSVVYNGGAAWEEASLSPASSG